MISTLNFALALLAAAVFYPVYTAIYNIYFHPLRLYPGPKLNAVTRLPYINNLIKGNTHRYIQSLHEQYGDVVRVNPDELSYAKDVWRDIYGHRSSSKEAFEKDVGFLGPDLVGNNGLVRARGNENHGRIRKVFSHAFSDRALKDQEPIFQQYVDQLVGNIRRMLQQDPKAKVPISDLYNFTTFDVMGDLTFGEPLGLLSNGKYSAWVAAIFGSLQLVIIGRILRWYPLLNRSFQFLLSKENKEKRRQQVNYSVERVDKRLARGESDRPDIWTCISKQKEENRLSYPEMQSSASTFMIAGTETTATLLSGLTFLLLKYPDVYAKLVHEIRSAFNSADEINMNTLAQMEYTNACIEEALRMYPPVPVGMPRVTPSKGAIVGGQPVPAGTVVSISNLTAYHSERNFYLADQFIPERWLGDPRFASDNKNVLQPFSYGPRNCIGKNLAYHEMRVVLVKVLYNFEFENLCEESENWIDQKVWGFWKKPQLMVQLTERVS
ncbi:Cytochrome P450 [Neofusicoccum parvum]|uniref:Cytochrome P450 n=1 Tax=Neofusicoccum parvum TaxID=310453 RepID=A0ACB5S9C5_9PEZI|nr:Cytochrome P450 [Neofusicoccum parvum]